MIGRRLVERLLRAGWIEPVRSDAGGIFYGEHALHCAVKRVQREGWLIDGHVQNDFRSETKKVRRPSLEDVLVNFSAEDLFSEYARAHKRGTDNAIEDAAQELLSRERMFNFLSEVMAQDTRNVRAGP